ncbi:hypothetical protein RJ639_041599 [Escallonia herrerae]|uniref:WRKY domain-containing protein n=1 Tax=Escallonia herrerae TaxID=1293975 RepID=A0AA89B276_9ASTE|nr:hypothetical protein RJ639_041599 [Escallonia herrerae]
MERVARIGEKKALIINELIQGKELANQLKNRIDTTTTYETCEFLVEKILSSYEKALSMLNWSALLESPHSLAGTSPRSENYDSLDCLKDQKHKQVFKKRKTTLPRWSEQVHICSGTGSEVPPGDGYSWRKYGQKDILGCNFPRAYYRCTHRNAQGCLAVKQVQKSDENPSLVEITYRGRHTCSQASRMTTKLASFGDEDSKGSKDRYQPQPDAEISRQSQEVVSQLEECLKTENLDTNVEIFPSFSFPSTPFETESLESHFFSESAKEDNFLGDFPPQFILSAASESIYFPLPPNHMTNLGMVQILQSPDSVLTEIVSATTSVANSPTGDLSFSLDQVDFDPKFLDIPEFFL